MRISCKSFSVSLAVAASLVLLDACVGDEPASGLGSDHDAASADGSTGDGATPGDAATGGDSSTTDGSTTDGGDAGAAPHVPIVDAYFKASNSRASSFFGTSAAISADGNTMAVGALEESSGATGVNNTSPGQSDTSTSNAGAVYVFVKSGGSWTQVAYVKASNTSVNAFFGSALALSSDGTRMIVGARSEATTQTGSGAAYFFQASGTGTSETWVQIGGAVKASNIQSSAQFGSSVAISGDGNTAVVGAIAESASDTGVSSGAGGAANGSFSFAGSAYLYAYSGGNWTQTNYVKPSNTQAGGRFGWSVALANDGSELAVGAEGEASSTTGVGVNSTDMSAPFAGATYIFSKSGSTWSQSAYIKASNTRAQALFGKSVSLGGVGGTVLAVGSSGESSGATGVDDTTIGQGDTSANNSGAVYLFTRSGSVWSQLAYMKASNTRASAAFGNSVSLSVNGNTLAIGSPGENSAAVGVNGTTPGQDDTSVSGAGAVYVFTPVGGRWTQTAYVKSSFAHPDTLGTCVGVTNNAAALIAGGQSEPSSATGINGNAALTGANASGAVFSYK